MPQQQGLGEATDFLYVAFSKWVHKNFELLSNDRVSKSSFFLFNTQFPLVFFSFCPFIQTFPKQVFLP